MKIQKKQSNKTKNILLSGSALAVVLVLVIVFIRPLIFDKQINNPSSNTNSSDNIDYSPATNDQKQSGSDIKANGGSDQPSAPAVIPGSNKKKVEVTITSTNQNNSILQIRTLVSTVTSEGTCTLTLSKTDSADIIKTAPIQPLASTSTCKGFDISTSGMSKGSWRASIVYDSDTLTGSVSKDLIIE